MRDVSGPVRTAGDATGRGAVPTAPGRARNVADLLADAARDTPDAVALIWQETATSWAELDAAATCLAAGLRRLGLAEGDRVALLLGNVPAFATAYFGVLRAGLVVVPLNPSLTGPERLHVLGDSGARVVISHGTDAGALLELRAQLPDLETVVSAGVAPAGALDLTQLTAGDVDATAAAPRHEGGERLAVIAYTSGTSGRPRGAMLSHRALLANLDQTSAIEPAVAAPGDVVLLVLPLFHIYGLNAGLGLAVRHGVTCVLAERFDPADTLALLARHEVTVVVGAPPMYVAWSMLPETEQAFATVRLALSGAAPLPPSVLAQMREVTGHHIFEGYGLTETAPTLTSTLQSVAAKPGSIGKPVPGVELRLADPGDASGLEDEDAPADAETGVVGVIEVRGRNLFSGYWPDGAGGPDADGWWSTGDVAYADDEGDLHLVDRARELIIVSGFNVYPREVEEVLDAHPAIAETAVLAIPHPYTGQSVKALVVTVPGATLTTDEVIDWAASSLARFKCPTAVQFVGQLPHTSTGKVSKGRLRELTGEPG